MRVILFNLYPYRVLRENRRRRRVLFELVLGLLLGLILCLSVSSEFDARLEAKQAFIGNLSALEADVAARVLEVQAMKDRVAVLNRQIKALEQVEVESLLASEWVSYLDSTVPSTVSLTRLMVEDDVMFISGFTSAVASLAKWVDQMEAGNVWFSSVELVSVTDQTTKGDSPARSGHVFEMRAMLRGGDDAPQ
jgi:Tfp pilus assembly protein PilN